MNRLCTQSNHGIHIMEAFKPISHMVPANNYQIVGDKILIPIMQPQDNTVPNLQNFQYQQVPLVKTTGSVPGGYESVYTNNPAEQYAITASDQYSITTNFANTRIILNNGEYVIKNSIANAGNSSEVFIVNSSPCSVLFTSSANSKIPNNITPNDKYKACTNQEKNTEKSDSAANSAASSAGSSAPSSAAKNCKSSATKRVKTGIDTRDKLGNLHIHVSESFMPWNVKNKLSFDLNFMRNLFDITNVDIIFPRDCLFESGVFESVRQIVINNILSDWLILKCEARQIPFYKVNNQIEIFSINSFSALVRTIVQESCLPLPYITRASNKVTKFFFINFPKDSNDKIPKLNAPIFHNADNGKKLSCTYPGIRIDTLFEPGVKCFTIHVHKSAMHTVQFWLPEIRRSLIYNHIIWGFLQAWIRRLRDNCNNCFKVEDIARNLSLFQKEQSDVNDLESDRSNAYFIGYKNYYLKFDTIALKGKRMSFSIENFETEFVSNIPIIQYYRQYFLINDIHYSDALKNILLYTDKITNVKELVYVPVDTVFKRNSNGPSQFENLSNKSQTVQGNINLTEVQNIQNQSTQMKKKSLNATNQPQNIMQHKEREAKRSNHSERGQNANNNRSQSPEIIFSSTSQQTTSNPKSHVSKPLIKTRTVEEINSSVDLLKSMVESAEFRIQEYKHKYSAKTKQSQNMVLNTPNRFQSFLENCYKKNFFEISSFDESTDPVVKIQRFDEAVADACDIRIIDSFIEKVYCKLQINFTNATCQSLLNKRLPKLLAEKFPNLDNEMNSEDQPNESVQSDNQKNTQKSPSRNKEKEKDSPSISPLNLLNKDVDKNKESSEIQISPEKKSTHLQAESDAYNMEDEAVQIEKVIIDGSLINEFSVNEELVQVSRKSTESVIVENIPQITDEHPIQCSYLPEINHENKMEENTKSFAEKEKFLKRKYNIKPCSVILDRDDITNYKRLRKLYSKKRERPARDADDDDDGDVDDEDDDEYSPKSCAKRPKKVTELEIMEAKTRVLQRLRKRNEMYIGTYNCERLYTGEELEPFLVCRNIVHSMPNTVKKKRKISEVKKVKQFQEKSESTKMKSLLEECEKKELRVLLTRVEDLPEYKKYKLKSKTKNHEMSNNSAESNQQKIRKKDTNSQTKSEDISNLKDGYFEVRSGRLYLKENYNVRNGTIVPVEKSPEKIIPKKEPEANFVCDYIKQEIQN